MQPRTHDKSPLTQSSRTVVGRLRFKRRICRYVAVVAPCFTAQFSGCGDVVERNRCVSVVYQSASEVNQRFYALACSRCCSSFCGARRPILSSERAIRSNHPTNPYLTSWLSISIGKSPSNVAKNSAVILRLFSHHFVTGRSIGLLQIQRKGLDSLGG